MLLTSNMSVWSHFLLTFLLFYIQILGKHFASSNASYSLKLSEVLKQEAMF